MFVPGVRRLLALAIFVFIMLSAPAFPCSRVLWPDNGMAVVVGRSMDWFEDTKTNLWVLPRGISRNGAAGKNSLTWKAKYGSLVATVYDIGTADGINEKGLTTNLLWLAESDYGKRDERLPGLCISLWAQYFLDNFSSVAEAVSHIQNVPVQLATGRMGKVVSTVHLSLADATGDSAIVEYREGKPKIYHDRKYTVMTNSPTYDLQLANLKQYKPFGGLKDLPGSEQAADRFVRAARYLAVLPKPKNYRENIAYMLSVMRNISSPFGVADPLRPNVSSTRWRTVADLTNRVYFFESTISPNIVWASLSNFDFQEGGRVLKLNLTEKPDEIGEISGKFQASPPFVFKAADLQ